jgi:hypothetical protein
MRRTALKAILRSAIVVASLATAVATTGAPASATGVIAFDGTATISCFGCGDKPGTAALTGVGVNNGAAVSGSASASYTVHEGTGTGCVVSGAADGTVTGAINVSFNWNRVGAVAVINTTGDINGSGEAAFVVTTAGLPCGTTNLQAHVDGEVHAA